MIPDHPGEFDTDSVIGSFFTSGVVFIAVSIVLLFLAAAGAVLNGDMGIEWMFSSVTAIAFATVGSVMVVPSFVLYHAKKRYRITRKRP